MPRCATTGIRPDEIRKKSLFHIHDKRDHGELDELYGVKDGSLAGRTWNHLKSDGTKIDVAVYSRDVVHERDAGRAVRGRRHHRAKERRGSGRLHGRPRRADGPRQSRRFNTHTEELLTAVRRGQKMIATLCIGLDNFKSVNDALGHSAGDLLLKCVAQRISEMLRHGDLAARVGGDEFAVASANVNGPSDISAIAQRINAAISTSYNIMGNRVVIGSSIGVAVAPGDGDDAKTLLKNANIALAQVKDESKGTFRYFEPAMNARVQARCRIENELRTALDLEELEVHYQPLVALDSGKHRRRRSAGALARSQGRLLFARRIHTCRRGCRPYRAARLIRDERACAGRHGLARSHAGGRQPVSAAVPVRQTSSRPSRRRCTRSGLPPQRLEVEITETLFLDKSEVLTSTLNALARSWRPHRHGRLRHRLFVARLPVPLSVRQDQDRPLLRAVHEHALRSSRRS